MLLGLVLLGVTIGMTTVLLPTWVYVMSLLVYDEWVAWSETNPTHPLAQRSALCLDGPREDTEHPPEHHHEPLTAIT